MKNEPPYSARSPSGSGVRNRDGKRSHCVGRVPRLEARGVQDCDPLTALRLRVRQSPIVTGTAFLGGWTHQVTKTPRIQFDIAILSDL
jgi:hypothetical protein